MSVFSDFGRDLVKTVYVMLLLPLRTRYLWFMTVSIIYVLLVFVLHRHLLRFNVPDMNEEATEVDGVQWTVDDQPQSLAFPVARRCAGESLGPPSRFLPFGRDWLYTAYFDDRLVPNPTSGRGDVYIRVLALLRRRDRKPTFYFWWPQSETGNATTEAAAAEAYEMCENHGRRYGGWILSTKFAGRVPPCYVTVTQDRAPASVQVRLPLFRMSVAEASTVKKENTFWLAGVSLLRELAKDRRVVDAVPLGGNFAVCVPPLYGAIVPATLVQFVELTRLLGAEHFIFYVSGVSAPVRRVLEAYEAENLVTTIRWVLPSATAKAVWYNGQLLAANDCLYRTTHAFQYVAFNDVDEFIVPHSAANWSQMLAELTSGAERRRLPTATTELRQLTASVINVSVRH